MKKKLLIGLTCLSSFVGFSQTALDFDGVNDHVYVSNQTTANFTLEFWMKTTTSGANGGPNAWQGSGLLDSDVGGNWNDFILSLLGNRIAFWDGSNNSNLVGSINVVDGNWHHIALTRQASGAINLYVDGVFDGSAAAGGAVLNANPNINIGTNFPPNLPFTGQMDEVRIWSLVRTQIEIQTDMNNCLAGNEPGLIGLYNFEDGTGSNVASDASPSNNHGTLLNMDPNTDWVTGYGCIVACSVVDQTIFEADWSDCPGTDSLITLNGSESGFNYFLRNDVDNSIVDGPIAGTGSAINFSTGLLNTTTTFNVFAGSGPLSEALDFDGSDDFVVGSDASFPSGSAARTIEGWVNVSTAPAVYGAILEYGTNLGGQQFSLGVHSTGRPFFWGSSADLLGTTNIVDGNWHHLAVSYDGVTVSLYLDGNLDASAAISLNTIKDGTYFSGRCEATGWTLDGSVDDLQIWNTTRSQAEIQSDMNTCLTGTEPNLIAYLDLNDGAGSAVATDQTGNGMDGTLQNMDVNSDWVNGISCYTCSLEMTDMLTVTISDTQDPSASNPATVNVECIGDVPAADPLVVTDETDNCDTSPVVAFVSDVSDGNACPETITRTYSVTDASGNSINVQQLIIVNDVSPPTASNPATINVQCIADVPPSDPSVVTDEADNCTLSPVVAFVSDVSDGNSCPETITRTYSITDDCGNSSSVVQMIIVLDTTSPTASNPADINVECSLQVPAADPAVVTDEADNCTLSPTVAFVSDVSDGLTCPETITRTYSVTDDCGNQTLVTQDIIILDITPPSISCPADVVASADQGSCEALVNWGTVLPLDNCSASPSVSSTHSSGSLFPEGITTVTYTSFDDCGNMATCQFDITVNNTLTVSLDSVWNTMCADSTDGQVFVTVTGGSGSNVFDWDHDGTGDNDDLEDQSDLADGTYNLMVTDAAGCTATTSAIINEPVQLVVNIDGFVNPSACGMANGSVDASVTGGTSPFNYDWNSGFATSEDISGLTAGSYVITVLDDNGCVASNSQSLSDPAGPIISIDATTDNLCNGDTLGTIDASIAGGLAPYIIDWDNDGTGDNDDNEDIANLGAGTFNITVTDDNGCVGSTSATINEPSVISTAPSLTAPACFGDSTGTALLNESGGTGALTIDWGAANPNMLPAGFHTYSVTDANSCVFTDSIEITQPSELNFTDSTLNITCNALMDGEIYINPVGGTSSYLVIWTADTANMQTGLAAGFHVFTIEDMNGCTVTDSIEITEPTALSLSTTVTNEMFGSDGSIDLTASGGIAPFTFDWDNDGTGDNDDTEDLTGLSSGTYTVVVTDSNGCTDSIGAMVDSELGIEPMYEFELSVYPNPNQGVFVIDLIGTKRANQLMIMDASGKLIHSETIGTDQSIQVDISNLSDGLYFVKVFTEDGNVISQRVVKK